MRRTLIALGVISLALVVFELAVPGPQIARMQRVTFDCDTDYQCAQLPPCKLKEGCDGGPYTEPYRLVGYDCQWAFGPIYRDEEDEFPLCGEITRVFE